MAYLIELSQGDRKILNNIESDLNSIDRTLDRIATALEKLAEGKGYEALSNQIRWCDEIKMNCKPQCIYSPKEPTEVKNEEEWPGNV